MKEFTIGKNDAGQRLDRWITKTVPLLSSALVQKYIRIKRIKLNGKGAKADSRLHIGDVIQLYVNDEFFEAPDRDHSFLSTMKPKLDIIYEDGNLALLNKRPGILSHPDEHEQINTLITHFQAYLYQKKEWSPYQENSFTPALCNRIDRNTGGIVIAAKNAEALRIMNQKIKNRELQKLYLCIVHGEMVPPQGKLSGFLLKEEGKPSAQIFDHPVPGGKPAVTTYRTLAKKRGLSLLECDLITGRTHQIRAQFAACGHPLLGDKKYGHSQDGIHYHRSYQALYSYKLKFSFTTDAGCLNTLNGREWAVTDIDFLTDFFPDFCV